MTWLAKFLNWWRRWLLGRAVRRLAASLESALMDDLLECLLGTLRLAFRVDESLRKNIAGFDARYVFRSRSRDIAASAVFGRSKMTVRRSGVSQPDVAVTFKDGKALRDFLFAENPDVFAFVLESKLTYEGNLNYLLKFSYMARHLKLSLGL
jgi:hypothetical protein